MNEKVEFAKQEINEKYEGLAAHIKKMEEKIKDIDAKASGKKAEKEERIKDYVGIENLGLKQSVQSVTECPAYFEPEGNVIFSS